jgi:hypothetical protein
MTHEEIDKFAQHVGPSWDAKIIAGFHKQLDKQTAAYGEAVKPIEAARYEAWDQLDEALTKFLDTVPTTAAGLAAMLACCHDHQEIRNLLGADNTYFDTFLATVASATAKLGR